MGKPFDGPLENVPIPAASAGWIVGIRDGVQSRIGRSSGDSCRCRTGTDCGQSLCKVFPVTGLYGMLPVAVLVCGCLSPVRVRFHLPLCGMSGNFGAGAYPNIVLLCGVVSSFSVWGISAACSAAKHYRQLLSCVRCFRLPTSCGGIPTASGGVPLIPGDLLIRDGTGRSGRYTGVYLS